MDSFINRIRRNKTSIVFFGLNRIFILIRKRTFLSFLTVGFTVHLRIKINFFDYRYLNIYQQSSRKFHLLTLYLLTDKYALKEISTLGF